MFNNIVFLLGIALIWETTAQEWTIFEDATLAVSSYWSQQYSIDNIKIENSRPWHDGGRGVNQWITFAFPYEIKLYGFRTKAHEEWDGSAFKDYKFEVSFDNGATWKNIFSGQGKNQDCCDWQEIVFDDASLGSYFRFTMANNWGYGWLSIEEMQFLMTISKDYSQTSGTYCPGRYGRYPSFNKAKNACKRDGSSCMGIYSESCRKTNYRLCRSPGSWKRSRIGSCVFKKAAGTEATVGFPQMNVVTNENAVAMTKEEEILAECFGEELDDSQIQEGSGQEEIINVNNPNEESVGLGFGTSKIKTQENLLDIGYKSIAIFGLGLVAGSGLVALVLKNRKDPMKVSLLMDQEI